MVMRQHCPKTAHRHRREIDTQLRQIAFKISTDKRITPFTTKLRIVSQQCTRKTTAQPACIQPVWRNILLRNFMQRQPIQLVKNHPASQTLGGMLKQLGCSTPQNQKSCRCIRSISQDSYQGKNIRAELDLVQHHQAFKFPQNKSRISKPCLIAWIFQIEMTLRPIPVCFKLTCKRCFTHLPCSQNSNHRKVCKLPLK